MGYGSWEDWKRGNSNMETDPYQDLNSEVGAEVPRAGHPSGEVAVAAMAPEASPNSAPAEN